MSEFIAPNSITAITAAEKAGLVCVFPKPNELQIDIDDAESMKVWKRHRQVLEMYWGIVNEDIQPSRSGKPNRYHITVTVGRGLKDLERCALQAMCGSDRMRELLSLVQVLENDPHPTLFVEKVSVRVSNAS